MGRSGSLEYVLCKCHDLSILIGKACEGSLIPTHCVHIILLIGIITNIVIKNEKLYLQDYKHSSK